MLYLLHATVPANEGGRHSARHYLGYSPNPSTLARRVQRHRAGKGSHLTLALANLPNQELLLVSVWTGDRSDERRVKGWHKLAQVCPVCNQNAPIGTASTPLPPPRRAASRLPSPKPAKATGGGWPASSTTLGAGSYPPAPHQESDMW